MPSHSNGANGHDAAANGSSSTAERILTTPAGQPVPNFNHILTAGPRGPIVLQDNILIDHLTHFARERAPERSVHAHGSGFKGYFETTHDMSKYTKARLYNGVGTRTPVTVRFSTVGGEKGSADLERDPRGFSVKHYTPEGNFDMVGNNTPVFFIREPIQFPSLLHSQKRNPQTNLKDADAFWDFASLVPESVHQFTILMSDRGIPASYMHMHGFSSHTFKWVNEANEAVWIKMHYRTDQGIKNYTTEEAGKITGSGPNGPNHVQEEMFNFIQGGGKATWTLSVQIIPLDQAETYRYDIFDLTKVVPFSDFPLIEVGKLVLDKNVDNYFAEVEQVAFSPANLVPGIESSPDKILQARLFSYADAHRHRIGPNFIQVPINCPFASKAATYQRDGAMTVNGNGGATVNYFPNSRGANDTPYLAEDKSSHASFHSESVGGKVAYHDYKHPNSDFEQVAELWNKVFSEDERERTVQNIVSTLSKARKSVQDRQVAVFTKVDPSYGKRVAEGLAKTSKA